MEELEIEADGFKRRLVEVSNRRDGALRKDINTALAAIKEHEARLDELLKYVRNEAYPSPPTYSMPGQRPVMQEIKFTNETPDMFPPEVFCEAST